MNPQKCELIFMVLQINIAIGSTNFMEMRTKFIVYTTNLTWTSNQFHYMLNNFMIWCPYSQFHKINFMTNIALFHKEWYVMYKILLIAPTTSSTKFQLTSLIQPCTMCVVIVCMYILLMYRVGFSNEVVGCAYQIIHV